MNGRQAIEEQLKGPFLRRKRGMKLIDCHNKQWTITFPKNDTKFGTAQFTEDAKKITLDLTNVQTVDLIACDDTGAQHTFRLIGYMLPE